MALTNIANRLTPSVPIELTYGAAPVATGTKQTTIFGHMAASGGTGTPYQVYDVINVGDPVAGPAEVEALAGAGAEIVAMVTSFINGNVLGGFGNFPQFRVVLIPFGVSNFGPNQEAINAVTSLRSDMLISCYLASDSTNATTLLNLATLISGIDRDLQGQFGTFAVLGSLDPLATAIEYDFNSVYLMVAYLQDTNTASGSIVGTVTNGSPNVTAVSQTALTPTGTTTASSTSVTSVSSVAGIYPGASITGTGIPTNTVVEKIVGTTLTISNPATSSNAAETLTITNLPTAGIYPGAVLTGTGIPASTTVLSVAATTLTMSANATATGAAESIAYQNMQSQTAQELAAAFGGTLMGFPFPYVPAQNVTVGGVIPPQKTSDWIQIDPNGASEAALTAGLAPMFVQPGGTVAFIRTVTTLTMNGTIPVTAYFDWQDIVKMYDFREACFDITQNPPFNNNPGGALASQFIANLLKDEVLREAQVFEDEGAFQGVQFLAPQFQVQLSTTSRGRFDFKIPVNVVPGLFVIAGNIEGVSGTAFGDFQL